MTKEGSSQDVQSSHLQSLEQGNASLQTLQKAAKAQSGLAGPTLAGGVLPGSAPRPAILGLHRDLHSRTLSLPAAAATGHVTPCRQALPPWPKAELFPSGRPVRAYSSDEEEVRPPAPALPQLTCVPSPVPQREVQRAGDRLPQQRGAQTSGQPGAHHQHPEHGGGLGSECRRPARPPCPRDRQDCALGGPPAPERAGKPAAVTETETARPGLHRSSPGEPRIPSAPGERSGRHSLGLGLRGGLQ